MTILLLMVIIEGGATMILTLNLFDPKLLSTVFMVIDMCCNLATDSPLTKDATIEWSSRGVES